MDAESVPVYATVLHEFWGEQLPHIVVGLDDVRVVLQDIVKKFSGINDPSNLSSKMKIVMSPYINGICTLEHLAQLPYMTLSPKLENTLKWYLKNICKVFVTLG